MSRQKQPPVPLVSLVKTESLTVIKNEPPEEALEKEISLDISDIDIVYHSLSEDLIKSETVPVNILETKYSESLETQVLVKTEDLIEVQDSHEHSDTLSNLETHDQLVLNSFKDLNGIGKRIRKEKHSEKTNFAKCYKRVETTSWEKDKEKMKVIKAPVIPVEAHEYTSLAEGEYVCNHCQHACNKLNNLKRHINKMHREATTMYQCPYCPYKSKWTVRDHIIQKHKDSKDIQWFQCNLCEIKFKLKYKLTQHMKVHLKYKKMKDGLDLHEKRYYCDNCDYKTYDHLTLKRHKLVHLKPEEIEYFYCYHCSYKCQRKDYLKPHIFRHHFENAKEGKRHHCDQCDYKTDRSTSLKSHKIIHLKPEEIQYFYCHHCSHKSKQKCDLKKHIFRHHFKNVRRGKRLLITRVLLSIIGFIDGTKRAMCRPSVNQEEYCSGHKKIHCLVYQPVLCPDDMLSSLKGSYPGRSMMLEYWRIYDGTCWEEHIWE